MPIATQTMSSRFFERLDIERERFEISPKSTFAINAKNDIGDFRRLIFRTRIRTHLRELQSVLIDIVFAYSLRSLQARQRARRFLAYPGIFIFEQSDERLNRFGGAN